MSSCRGVRRSLPHPIGMNFSWDPLFLGLRAVVVGILVPDCAFSVLGN